MFIGQNMMEQEQKRNLVGNHMLSGSSTAQRPLCCAWCLSEQGLEPGNGSHGICVQHASQLLQQYKERNAHTFFNSK